jgi:8-oxo-dGTP pyrophosphatase MutT (NUDIX family)
MREFLDFRQRAAAYVLRRLPGRSDVEVLVILHRDTPEAGVQVPGGGALAHETIGEAAVREACEETGVESPVFGEAMGNKLMRGPMYEHGHQVTTYCWLRTADARDAWDHTVVSHDEDDGLRMRCEFRPVGAAGIGFGMDRFLLHAADRFAAAYRAPVG